MVVRTGLNTTVGNMLRPLLHSHWARKHLRSFMGFYREVNHMSTSHALWSDMRHSGFTCFDSICSLCKDCCLVCYILEMHLTSPAGVERVAPVCLVNLPVTPFVLPSVAQNSSNIHCSALLNVHHQFASSLLTDAT